jgi:hypothetical protein
MIDAERIFAYRVLRLLRGDQTPLPGFDENAYVSNTNLANQAFNNLAPNLKPYAKLIFTYLTLLLMNSRCLPVQPATQKYR